MSASASVKIFRMACILAQYKSHVNKKGRAVKSNQQEAVCRFDFSASRGAPVPFILGY
jgi:hypothetical protein